MTIKYQGHEFKGTEGEWITQGTHPTPNGLDELIRSANNTHVGWAYKPEDAQLIAAAPRLLQALIGMMDWNNSAELVVASDQAHAAILQALGVDNERR